MAKTKDKPSTGTYVCGMPVEKIRKAYFDCTINKLCAEIMAAGKVTVEDMKALTTTLEELKREESKVRESLEREVGGLFTKEHRPPSVEALQGKMSDEDRVNFEAWLQTAERSVKIAREIIGKNANAALQGKSIPKDALMNDAHAMNGLMLYVQEYASYRRAIWKARMFKIQDESGISRGEAEDRSEITEEYADYKRASGLLERCDNLIMNCKKEYGDGRGY
jgi:hypothetical protein